jgi:2-polyprenyl-3-methyl-5-hydroxy-6-metoxy-1,4-benzoquinol methylase
MDFMFDYSLLPKNYDLLKRINSASHSLSLKLAKIDLQDLVISDYNKRYLGTRLKSLRASLQLYSYILAWALERNTLPIDQLIFLDHGGGTGILSLLARELGIGTVIYNDIYDVSCKDARLIGKIIGNEADYYFTGDIEELVRELQNFGLNCDIVASFDVIEHVYDIKDFFYEKVPNFSEGPLTIFMASGANPFNPIIKRKLRKKQIEVEQYGTPWSWGHKERDTCRSYLEIRREMVLQYCQKLGRKLQENEIEKLAQNTRGKVEREINRCVDSYLNIGKLPPSPTHPTNTCDPYTGNWMEHLMDPFQIARNLEGLGFRARVFSGFYGSSSNPLKRILGKLLNFTIAFSRGHGIRFAPFYAIYGHKSPIGR